MNRRFLSLLSLILISLCQLGREDVFSATVNWSTNQPKEGTVSNRNNTFVIDGSFEIPAGKTLTIDGGTVQFLSKTITVKGKLVITGDAVVKSGCTATIKGGGEVGFSKQINGVTDGTTLKFEDVTVNAITTKGSVTISMGDGTKVTGDVTLSPSAKILVPEESEVAIGGSFSSQGKLSIASGADISISKSVTNKASGTIICYSQMTVMENFTNNGNVSTFDGSNVSITGNLTNGKDGTFNIHDGKVGGDVSNNNKFSIASGSRLFVSGNVTNLRSNGVRGEITCNGRLVVGALMDTSDGKTIISTNGKITNYGTIKIETPAAALDLALDPNPSLLENSVYYAGITCENFVNGSSNEWTKGNFNGEVDMTDGSLIVQKDLDLWYCSKLKFQGGTSYVDVWNDLTQYDRTYEVKGEEAVVKLDKESDVNAKAVISVRETYDDWTTLDNARETHDWDLDNNQFTIDPNITLSVGSYDSRNTEYLDENTYIADDWGWAVPVQSITKDVYSTDYNYMDGQITSNEDELMRLRDELVDWEGPSGIYYSNAITLYGSNRGKTFAQHSKDSIQTLIDLYESLNETLGLIESFGESNLTLEQLKTLNDWFYNSTFGRTFVSSARYIKSGNSYYSYKKYFKDQFVNNPSMLNNHLKLYHYILAYMGEEGHDKMYYDQRHDSLSVMLPIELSYFNVTQEGSFVVFEWTTETETNNDFFTVEYSIDGVQYNALTNVEGAGTSTEKLMYSADAEADMFDGIVYFRLKQTDFNGESTYSEVKALDIQSGAVDFVVYPNPAIDEITIEGGTYSKVYFVDMQSKTYPAELIGENQYSVENLPNGLNFVVIETARGPILKKIMIVRESTFEK